MENPGYEEQPALKTCTKCRETKPVAEFGRWASAKDGLRPQCKACHCAANRQYAQANSEKVQEYQLRYREARREALAEKSRKYYAANRDEKIEYSRKWAQDNKEKTRSYKRKYEEANRDALRERRREYREANPDRHREADRKYRAANPDKVRESQRKYREANPEKDRQYREANREAINERQRQYRQDNLEVLRERDRQRYAARPDKVKIRVREWQRAHPERSREVGRVAARRRRELLANAEGVYVDMTHLDRREDGEVVCWMCREPVIRVTPHTDHVYPLSKSQWLIDRGWNSTLRLTHQSCNDRKWAHVGQPLSQFMVPSVLISED